MIALLWNACTTHAGAPKTHVVGAAQVASSPSLDARVATAVADEEREVRVLIEGAHEVSAAELLASMFVGRDGARGEPDHDLLVRDEYVLQGLLADRGYLDARVEPLGVERSSDGLYFDVHVRLREGARYRVRSLAFNERDEHGKTVSPRPPG